MKKNRFLASALFALFLLFTSCSQLITPKKEASVSLTISRAAYRSIFDEVIKDLEKAEQALEDGITVKCTVTLTKNGTETESQEQSVELKIENDEIVINENTSADGTFTFEKIPFGTKVQATALLEVDPLKFKGTSEEKVLDSEQLSLPIKLSIVDPSEVKEDPEQIDEDEKEELEIPENIEEYSYKMQFKVLKAGGSDTTKADYNLDSSLSFTGDFDSMFADDAANFAESVLVTKIMEIYAQGYQILDTLEPDIVFDEENKVATITYYCTKVDV